MQHFRKDCLRELKKIKPCLAGPALLRRSRAGSSVTLAAAHPAGTTPISSANRPASAVFAVRVGLCGGGEASGGLCGRPARAYAAPAASAPRVDARLGVFHKKSVNLEVFHRVNTCTPVRDQLSGKHRTNLRVKLSGKHRTCTSSTDQVIDLDKYVQAGGLFIFGLEELKNSRSDLKIRESGRELTPTS